MMGKSYNDVVSGTVEHDPPNQSQGQDAGSFESGHKDPAPAANCSDLHSDTDAQVAVAALTTRRPATMQLDIALNERHWKYLLHFATKICADIVAFDEPGQNPMRDLIPATLQYPFLLHVMLANSAFHVFNISQGPVSMTGREENGRRHQGSITAAQSTPNHRFYTDALVAKQQALASLAKFITAVDPVNFDLVLGAVLLFINYDLIESGKEQWKPHLEGARKLISLLETPPYRQQPMSNLRTFLLSEFLVYNILGSTFRFSSSAKLFPDCIDLNPILQYAESNNYLSLPGPLMRIMLKSFILSESLDSVEDLSIEHQERLKGLLEEALAFNPTQWLQHFRPASPVDDLGKRLHIASAHRYAVCIYLARFIPYNNPLLDPTGGSAVISLTGLATGIIRHISWIKPDDTLFKSITWPLFLAGAESDDLEERKWILETLDLFYNELRWGYIRTVETTLWDIWGFKEEGVLCWVTEVKRRGAEILIA
ncbi:hypothetical protein M011DRAFT_468677 [Sporormia fimetaria CBS 119925]|uniref:Fungal-specific transcription factor domain-containing protein n=1 Tax=Sporormia fimetaria CBS 119925 TaxID=1340428 RepID=A0A6A6VAL2_9PLEO|nr:hypothetical protein M011DRAFT_468677 [Sporormia fimetaria CBS 119925]